MLEVSFLILCFYTDFKQKRGISPRFAGQQRSAPGRAVVPDPASIAWRLVSMIEIGTNDLTIGPSKVAFCTWNARKFSAG
jgi:hypothetical protein